MRKALLAIALTCVSLAAHAQLRIQFRNQGTSIGTFTNWLPINCSTNLTCSFSGGVVTMSAAGGGGISGLTTGVIPKAASSTTIGDSALDDGATTANTLTYTGTAGIVSPSFKSTASNGGIDGTEGTGASLTAATSHDLMWPDSTAHRWKVNNNNGGATTVALFTDGLNVFVAGALANGSTATTQSGASNDTKVATDAYVDAHFIANGTAVLNTAAVASGACETVVTVGATGVATTDVIQAGFNGDPTAVTGYGASATGAVLTIYPYPTANNVNIKVCNSTASSITPSAMTLNWKVSR